MDSAQPENDLAAPLLSPDGSSFYTPRTHDTPRTHESDSRIITDPEASASQPGRSYRHRLPTNPSMLFNDSVNTLALWQRCLIYYCPFVMCLMRLVQQIVLLIGMLWVIAIAIGFVFQEFLNVMTFKMPSHEVKQMLTLNWFPLILSLWALYLHYMADVTLDARDRPSFMKTRCRVAAAFFQFSPHFQQICAASVSDKERRQKIDEWFQQPSEHLAVLLGQETSFTNLPNWWWLCLIRCIEELWFTYAFTLSSIVGAAWRVCAYWNSGLEWEWSNIPTYAWGGAFVGITIWVSCTTLIVGFADLAMYYGQPTVAEHFQDYLSSVMQKLQVQPGHMANLEKRKRELEKCKPLVHEETPAQGKKLRDPLIPSRWFEWIPKSVRRGCLILIYMGLGQSFWYGFVCLGQWLGRGKSQADDPYAERPSNRPVLMFGGIMLIPTVILVNSGIKELLPSLHGYEDDPNSAKERDEDHTSRSSTLQGGEENTSSGSCPAGCTTLYKWTQNALWNMLPRTHFERFGWLFVIQAIILFGGLAFESPFSKATDHVDFVMTYNLSVLADGDSKAWVNTESPGYHPGYPVCSMRWSGGQLGVLDMIALATYSYTEHSGHYTALIEKSFPECSLQQCPIRWFDPYNITHEQGLPRVVAIHLPSTVSKFSNSTRNGTIVVAVKGSDQIADVYADCALYATIAILEFASFIIPVLDILPNGLIANIINNARSPLSIRNEAMVRDHLKNVTENLSRSYPEANIILTGHSLGGGLAQAIGAHQGLETIVFSSPGAHFSRERFKIDMEQQYRNLVNIVPDGDLIARVDRHDSTTQHIECRNKSGRIMSFSPYYCHLLQTTTCELWRACGDFRKRDFTKYCEDHVNMTKKGEYVAEVKASDYET